MSEFRIWVDGTPGADWLIYNEQKENGYSLWEARGFQENPFYYIEAGAPFVAKFLKEAFEKPRGNKVEIDGIVNLNNQEGKILDKNIPGSFSEWEKVEYTDKEDDGRKKTAIRIIRRRKFYKNKEALELEKFRNDKKEQEIPRVLVLMDTGVGYSDKEANWPWFLQGNNKNDIEKNIKQVFLRFHSDTLTKEKVTKNLLIKKLIDLDLAKKTTIIMSVNDLRRGQARIEQSITWEQSYRDIVNTIKNHFMIGDNLVTNKIIVTHAVAGAVIASQGKEEKPCYTLVFDRFHQEDDWLNKFGKGRVIGYTTCVLISLMAKYVDDLSKGIEDSKLVMRGLKAGRELHKIGVKIDKETKRLIFPFKKLGKILLSNTKSLKYDFAECKEILNDKETLLTKAIERLDSASKSDEEIKKRDEEIKKIVKSGHKNALKNVYIEEIGDWTVVDNEEIMGIRSIRNRVNEYLKNWPRKKPLSIAIFGSPGSGKSFAIKQLMKCIEKEDSEKRHRFITYNLSQLESPEELTTAYRQIRDLNLQNVIPWIFWDEFDCSLGDKELGWLRHFLAPMQDSEFYEEGFNRPLGPAIFAFAGGRFSNFHDFIQYKSTDNKAIKKPDFESRLEGYLNIKGINSNKIYPNLTINNKLQYTEPDEITKIRRAILLRSILKASAPTIFKGQECDISDAVIEAFINIKAYNHGIRSMDKIISMSSLEGKKKFTVSNLPTKSQLDVHIDGDEFLSIINRQSKYKQ